MIRDIEIVKADGNLYAFIKVQDEYTGNTSGSFRRVYNDKEGYYAKVEGKNHYVNKQVMTFLTRMGYLDKKGV